MTDDILTFLDNSAFGRFLYVVLGFAAIAATVIAALVFVVSFFKAVVIGLGVAAIVAFTLRQDH
jgi:hypothetical protein